MQTNVKRDLEDMTDSALAQLCYWLALANPTMIEAREVFDLANAELHGRTDHHYIFLDDPDNLGAMVGCGMASEAVTLGRELGMNLHIYEVDLAECPFCGPDTLEEDTE
jgi:hypothetical protein